MILDGTNNKITFYDGLGHDVCTGLTDDYYRINIRLNVSNYKIDLLVRRVNALDGSDNGTYDAVCNQSLITYVYNSDEKRSQYLGFGDGFGGNQLIDHLQIYHISSGVLATVPTAAFYVNLNYPSSYSLNNSDTYNISYTPVWEAGVLDYCALYINQTLNTTNSTAINNNTINYFNDIELGDGTYNISVLCSLTNGTSTFNNNTLIVDKTSPTISTNLQSYYTHTLYFNVTSTDQHLKNITIKGNCNISYENNSITGTNFIYNLNNFSIVNCGLGLKQINVTSCDNALNCISKSYNYTTRSMLNITAISAITNASIGNFSVWLNGTYLGSTSTYIYSISNLSVGYHNITIDAPTYEQKSTVIYITNTSQVYGFSLYGTNSILINIYDELTGAKIKDNVSIVFSYDNLTWTNYTLTGTLYNENITAATYNILIYGNGSYAPRNYIATLSNHSHLTLNAYLVTPTYSTIFTILDYDSSEVIHNASMAMYKQIGGSWVTVEDKFSDISGRVQFYYDPTGNYKFYISKEEYVDYVFYLNPILFSTYDVKISKDTLLNYSQDFDKLDIIYAPHYFKNNDNTTFTFIINSPYGDLIEYGINLTYPNGGTVMYSTFGSNAIGGQLNLDVNLSNASVYDTVKLDYYYITSISGRRDFTALLPISNVDLDSNMTFVNNRDTTYGLGIFERMLIATLTVIFVAGIATMVGQPIPGLALGLFIFGYMVYIGFIPIWLILPSMLIGVLFLIWKSGGY